MIRRWLTAVADGLMVALCAVLDALSEFADVILCALIIDGDD